MIHKDYCPDCDGLGHVPACKCEGVAAFIMGCCKKCGGEGYITVEPNSLLDADGKPIIVESL